MGFFSLSATCGICGNTCGLNRFRLKKSDSWICASCMSKAGGMATVLNGKPLVNNTVEEIKSYLAKKDEVLQKEYRKKCNVCGKVFCYTNADLEKNLKKAKEATGAAGMALLQSLAGTTMTASSEMNRSDNLSAQIKDYSKCPFCNSTDIHDITEEEWEKEQAKINGSSTVSAADELKKFKELLDTGVITQEEFDAKKKQLLGL